MFLYVLICFDNGLYAFMCLQGTWQVANTGYSQVNGHKARVKAFS